MLRVCACVCAFPCTYGCTQWTCNDEKQWEERIWNRSVSTWVCHKAVFFFFLVNGLECICVMRWYWLCKWWPTRSPGVYLVGVMKCVCPGKNMKDMLRGSDRLQGRCTRPWMERRKEGGDGQDRSVVMTFTPCQQTTTSGHLTAIDSPWVSPGSLSVHVNNNLVVLLMDHYQLLNLHCCRMSWVVMQINVIDWCNLTNALYVGICDIDFLSISDMLILT